MFVASRFEMILIGNGGKFMVQTLSIVLFSFLTVLVKSIFFSVGRK
jgi:hypothetical protein